MAKPVEGIVFPLDSKGERATTETSKNIFAAAFVPVDESGAKAVREEKNWRYNYQKHILKHVQACLKSQDGAIKAAQAGLDYLHNNFEFIRDGTTYKLKEAMEKFQGNLQTGFIKGTKPKGTPELVVPYKKKDLKGEELLKQVQKWADYGTIEQSAADAISMVVKNKGWADLSDKYFVMLGAGSAMGPYLVLMALGANIIAVDLDRPNIWKRLITIAEQSCGTITFPLKKPQSEIKSNEELYEQAGGNLITHAPEIYHWLKKVYPDKPLTVGTYVYLDGEAHVKVALACDAIQQGLCASRKAGVAFLCTPTDVHVITDEARKAALANYNSFSWQNMLIYPIRMFAGRKMLARNVLPAVKSNEGKEFSLVDGLVVPQGPNYALAKRMQHWRAVVARANGCLASSHVAPSTATASVVHNRQFAWAYDGMPFFKPFEIFEQDTSNAVMGAILIHDLRNTKAVANPDVKIDNPFALFKENSFHGGVWRCGYTIGSIGEVSVLVHFGKVLRPYFLLMLIAVLAYVFQKYK